MSVKPVAIQFIKKVQHGNVYNRKYRSCCSWLDSIEPDQNWHKHIE
ncbi:hypothetical protein OUHCRE5_51210 [Enterobacter asburiae]